MIFSIYQRIKWYFAFGFISFFIIFGISLNSFNVVISDYDVNTSNISLVPISYETTYVYTDELLYDEKKVISKGMDGYFLENSDIVVVNPINEIVEVGRGPKQVSYGSTTGYGADCVGCSGNVACPTLSGSTHNLVRDGVYYNDSTYGNVRIIAADNSLYSCGTIIEIDNGIMDPFMAIVMDTGGAMRSAWSNGDILIDIAFANESSYGVFDATNKSGNVKFKIYRIGW